MVGMEKGCEYDTLMCDTLMFDTLMFDSLMFDSLKVTQDTWHMKTKHACFTHDYARGSTHDLTRDIDRESTHDYTRDIYMARLSIETKVSIIETTLNHRNMPRVFKEPVEEAPLLLSHYRIHTEIFTLDMRIAKGVKEDGIHRCMLRVKDDGPTYVGHSTATPQRGWSGWNALGLTGDGRAACHQVVASAHPC